jgi:serine/threonine-protein kinase
MLSSGTRLGTYEVTSHIGSGGMGDVYQAHDTKLDRDVAIKVLPEKFARDPERLARFQREAKLLAALNHPNIATIHGLEQSGDTHYLVMELVPGETLAQRIKRDGPVPLEEALTIAKQIAEALEAAHEKPIIHRDLKPANVKVTPEGRVKVLDFGLAKAYAAEPAPEDIGNSPTLSMAATAHGVILGTAAYMSPEQARGKTVTKASDIWAFGCVLYELLTAQQLFQGEDIGDILATVVKTEPDWSRLPESTPPAIQTLLRRCLRKDPRQRLQDATGIRIEIEETMATPTAASTPAGLVTVPTKSRWLSRQALALSAAMLLLGLVLAGIAAWNLKPDPPRPVTRTVITLPQGDQLAAQGLPALALSPDGTQLAYVAIRNGVQQMYLRQLDSLQARPLLGTEGAGNPFFSPDGQWLGFLTPTRLAKISVNGGAAVTLGNVALSRGASWSDNGTIAFSANTGGPLQLVSDAGGAPQPLTQLDKGEPTHRWPEFLPGGNAFLFSSGVGTNLQIVVQSLASGQRHNLVPEGVSPRYLPSGHLLYVQGGNLMAAPFDAKRLQLTGAAVPVVEGIMQAPLSGAFQYAVSSTGSLVYVSGGSQAAQRLVWVTRNGVEQPLPAPPRSYLNPRISPDGRRIVVTISDQGSQVWLYDLSRETLTRLTFEGDANARPIWTPDGKRIAFDSIKEGPTNLFWQLADGSGGLERLTNSENANYTMSWSGDGQLLAFGELRPNTGRDISVLRLSDRKAQPFLQTRFTEGAAAFSSDGRWLAYTSDESGRTEVYVQPYPQPGGKWQISTEGGAEPVWNRNGRELFYRNGDKMMSVDISTQPTFAAGRPRLLFTGQYVLTPATIPYYDISPDGQRFLMVKANEQSQAAAQINVVLNFTEELKRRVPAGAN